MAFTPRFLTSQIGSVPHQESKAICEYMAKKIDIPAWPQLPRRSYRESMYVQYSPSLPGIVVDEAREKINFDTSQDISSGMEAFYEHYLGEDIDYFGLLPEYAEGFFTMMDTIKGFPGEWSKGQVTGPVSFGLTVTDQNLRASLYDETLVDLIIKNMAMNARWQVRQLKSVRPNTIIFVDEPYLASFGSAYISLSREQVIAYLDEIYTAIHAEGALGGVHCCANTDWSVLLATQVDILNLDAFGYLENLSLYTTELNHFFDRGGVVAWGIVPTGDEVLDLDAPRLAKRLMEGLEMICKKAETRGEPVTMETIANHSLVTPSCGLGSSSIPTAERVIETLIETGEILQKG